MFVVLEKESIPDKLKIPTPIFPIYWGKEDGLWPLKYLKKFELAECDKKW